MLSESSVPSNPHQIGRSREHQNHHSFVTPMGAARSPLAKILSDAEEAYYKRIWQERTKYVKEQPLVLGYMSEWTPKLVNWLANSLNIPENPAENFEWINLHCFQSIDKFSRNSLENGEILNLEGDLFPLSKIYETLYKINGYLRINWLDYDENPKYEEILLFRNSGIDQIKAGKFLSHLLNLDKMYFVEWWNILYCYDDEFFLSNSKQIDFANILTV